MVTTTLTSAAGVLALLREEEDEIVSYALEKLEGLVGEFWIEIADEISIM